MISFWLRFTKMRTNDNFLRVHSTMEFYGEDFMQKIGKITKSIKKSFWGILKKKIYFNELITFWNLGDILKSRTYCKNPGKNKNLELSWEKSIWVNHPILTFYLSQNVNCKNKSNPSIIKNKSFKQFKIYFYSKI